MFTAILARLRSLRPIHYFAAAGWLIALKTIVTTVAMVVVVVNGALVDRSTPTKTVPAPPPGITTLIKHHNTGFVLGNLPKPTQLPTTIGAATSSSLIGYVIRVPNQGTSLSCVGQTAANATSIYVREFGHRSIAFSGIWPWAQAAGGINQGTSYEQIFGLLTSEGEAPYLSFPFDGFLGWVYPQPYAYSLSYQQARSYRLDHWITIAPGDQGSIEQSVSSGLPVAWAGHIYESFLSAHGHLAGQSGGWLFDHSMLIVAYSPFGVQLLNSWGDTWGDPAGSLRGGTIWVSWGFLSYYGVAAAIPYPNTAPYRFHSKPKPRFPAKVWNQYRSEHHKSLVPYKSGKGLTWFARQWSHADYRRAGGVTRSERYDSKHHVMTEYLQGFHAVWRPGHPERGIQWKKRARWQK